MLESSTSSPKEWSVAVAILGARMHYAVPSTLASAGRLERFYTDFYLQDTKFESWMRQVLSRIPFKASLRAAQRYDTRIPAELVSAFPGLGILYVLALRMAVSESRREKEFVWFGRWFGQLAVRHGFGQATFAYGMNGTSVEWFEGAQQAGRTCILEQCSAPYPIYDQLSQEEYQLWPGWERDSVFHRNQYLFQRELQEWEQADLIICGSQFVADGLAAHSVALDKCQVVPYAVDVDSYSMKQLGKTDANQKLKVLFLGGIRIMKGIQYLYQALEQLGNAASFIEARAAGSIMVSPETIEMLKKHIHLLGLVPRKEVGHLLAWADVLVLPSICEGSALVTYEALASGVPVITTPNAGSPVQDGVTGFIVPNRNAAAIAERLEWLAQNPNLRLDMSIAARHYAEEHLSWEAYSCRLLAAIKRVRVK